MHRGLDLMRENEVPRLLEAVRCFDQAIALRAELPIETHDCFRYGLSAGWINRADTLQRLGSAMWPEAIRSYDQAIVLLKNLPLGENSLYCRRLAIAWLNRGVLLQRSPSNQQRSDAVNAFREAIAILEMPSATGIGDYQALIAGAWANLASALIDLGPEETTAAVSAGLKALAYARANKETDLVCSEAFLTATCALCRLAVRSLADERPLGSEALAETTDAIEDAMSLMAGQRFRARWRLAASIQQIFRFGCRIYEYYQPHFLAEFIQDYLDWQVSENQPGLDPLSFATAKAALWSALNRLLADGFQLVNTLHYPTFLRRIRLLRIVAGRLEQPIGIDPATV